MKNIGVFFLLILIVLLGCQLDNRSHSNEIKLKLVKTDSLEINLPWQISFIDYNAEADIFLFYGQGDLIETDRKGNILHQFPIIGKEKERVGSSISGIGYSDDGASIIVFSNKGYYFYSRSGELLRYITDPVKFGDQINKQVFHFKNENLEWIAATHKPFYDFSKDMYLPGDPRFYMDYRALTVLEIGKDSTFLTLGYEKDGIFLEDKERFFPDALLRFAQFKNNLFVLFNPDNYVYIYSPSNKSKSFSLQGKIELKPDYFKYPLVLNRRDDLNKVGKALLANSNYSSMVVNSEYLAIVYTAGISEEILKNIDASDLKAMSELSATYSKSYAMIYKDGVKISRDIELPFEIINFATFTNQNEVLAIPHKLRVESPDKEKWYFYRFEEL